MDHFVYACIFVLKINGVCFLVLGHLIFKINLFQEEISHLKDEFHAMDSLIATKNSEYENVLDEKNSLYEYLKLIEGKLREKELHLEDLILFKKEQVFVTESLNSVKEKLEQENKELMVNILTYII